MDRKEPARGAANNLATRQNSEVVGMPEFLVAGRDGRSEPLANPDEFRGPDVLLERYRGWSWERVHRNDRGTLTYRLEKTPLSRFLKIAPRGGYPSLAAESERMRWASATLPVPKLVEEAAGSVGDVSA